jgi:glycosyltransferase involved in cell wall biosynthesis
MHKLHVVYNGVAFAPMYLPPATEAAKRRAMGLPDRYLLSAGSYEPRKNLRTVLESFARVAQVQPDLALVMIVERTSGHAPALHAFANSLNLGQRLVFLHSLPEDDLRFVYTHAELFLFPSSYEGFGFPPLQAMSCGVPVIAAHTSSLPEVLGDAAWYIVPQRADKLANAIGTLLADDTRRHELRARGLATAARFTWERAARQTLSVYRDAT